MEALLKSEFKVWCKETKRSGGILLGRSLNEFFEWFAKRHGPQTEDKDESLGHIFSANWNGIDKGDSFIDEHESSWHG